MDCTQEGLAEREARKRKRLSEACFEALKKVAKENRHAEITDLPEELFNRNILEYLDADFITTLILDDAFFFRFNMGDYWCIDHECFLMDTGGKTDLEIREQIEKDGLDAENFFTRLGYRNIGDWVDENAEPWKEVMLDFDPVYRPYLLMTRRCPRCEIHAMKLILEGMPQAKEFPKCGKCLAVFKRKNVKMVDCSGSECNEKVCPRCSRLKCFHCKKAYCKNCSFNCDICYHVRCIYCSDLPDVEDRFFRECCICGFGICEIPCDPNSSQVFSCEVCERDHCSDCTPSIRCHCSIPGCLDPYCQKCVIPVSCDECGKTFRQDHAQSCSHCGGTLSALNPS